MEKNPILRHIGLTRKEGILVVPNSEDPIIAARGMLKGSGVSKAYLLEKEREKEREDRKFARTKWRCA